VDLVSQSQMGKFSLTHLFYSHSQCQFPSLSDIHIIYFSLQLYRIPGLFSPGEYHNKIPGLSRFFRNCNLPMPQPPQTKQKKSHSLGVLLKEFQGHWLCDQKLRLMKMERTKWEHSPTLIKKDDTQLPNKEQQRLHACIQINWEMKKQSYVSDQIKFNNIL